MGILSATRGTRHVTLTGNLDASVAVANCLHVSKGAMFMKIKDFA